ncbi:MAG: Gfo/Idh/MocA family protein [Thermoleophilaceae bacterium]
MSLDRNGSTPARRPLGIGAIGLGYWGPNLLRVLVDDADVVVRWICDRDEERLARFHRRYPATRPTTRLEDVLEDPAVDAVVVATPVFTHFDLAHASLAAGKHTFVEKPLAPSCRLADELIAFAHRVDRVLMCGHTFLYSPPVRAIKRLLDEGTLGELYFVSASRVNLGPYRRDVSVVWDLAPHDFSVLLNWFGEAPATLRATGRAALASGIADVAFITMTFASGVVANVELSWLAPGKLRRTVLVGSEKMIVYDDGSAEPVRVFDQGIVLGEPESFGQYHLSYRTGDIVSPRIESSEPLVAELADFVRAIRSGDRLDANVRVAREVVRMTEAAELSLNSGGEAISLNGAGSVSALPVQPEDPAMREPAA